MRKNLLESIIKIHSSIEQRANCLDLRSEALHKMQPLQKIAFDSRHINQYSDYNPRRNLQYFHRTEPFISKDASENVKILLKLKAAVDSIKEDFSGDPDWFDSYARILSSALDRTLRMDQKDFNFYKPQMDYLNELLYLRYRLKSDDIIKLEEKELRNIVLDRDEKLLHKQIFAQYNNGGLMKGHSQSNSNNDNFMKGGQPQQSVQVQQDDLIKTLFGDVKATAEKKNVSRSVTITINDSINEQEINKRGSDGDE